jgi:hypothetical protein
MNRFEQRLQKRLKNEEFAAGYREMEAELVLMYIIGMSLEEAQKNLFERPDADDE